MSSFSNPSQVLLRNLDLFKDQRVLIAGFNGDTFAHELCSAGANTVMAYGLDYHNHKALISNQNPENLHVQFAPYYDNGTHDKWQQLIMYWPKSKERAQYLLANVLPHLAMGADIYVVGENKGGVKSAAKQLVAYGDKPVKIDSARHCALYQMQYTQAVTPFDKAQWLKNYTVQADDLAINVVSLPGVFSHGELDLGTKLLLANLGHLKMKRTLDFGCGCGIIGTFIGLKRQGIPLELIDIDALAIESATLTLAANNVKAKVYPSDGLDDLHGKFATIISNPPFHSGLKTDYSVPEQLLSNAPSHLMDGGQLRIVANNFLRYEGFLTQHFNKQELIVKDNKFKVLSAKT